MHLGQIVRLVVAPALLLVLPLAAQTLPARPVPFEEPVQGGNWKDGELVLGKTTLAGARRMLAPAARSDNPSQIPVERVWEVGGAIMRPRWQYDPGEGYFQLFFDDNERLIYALDRTPHPKVSRVEFLSHYPRALRAQQSGSFDQYQVDVQPCVTLTALVDRAKEHVIQFGYAWTCRTHSVSAVGGPVAAQGR